MDEGAALTKQSSTLGHTLSSLSEALSDTLSRHGSGRLVSLQRARQMRSAPASRGRPVSMLVRLASRVPTTQSGVPVQNLHVQR